MSLLGSLQNLSQAMGRQMGSAAPQQPGTRFNQQAMADGRAQTFLNMYANRLVNRALNASSLSYDGSKLNFEGSASSFPNQDSAWNDYSAEARNRGIQPNYAAFSGVYAEAWKTYQAKQNTDMTNVLNANPSLSAIRKDVKNNPNLREHLLNLKQTTPEMSQYIDNWMPEKPFSQKMADSPLKYKALMGLGLGSAYAGGRYLARPNDPKALSKYRTAAKSLIDPSAASELKDARKYLLDIKAKKSYKGKASDIKAAEQLVKEAQKKWSQPLTAARSKAAQGLTSNYQEWFGPKSMMGKTGAFGRGLAYGIVPDALSYGVEGVSGDKRLGDYAGGLTRTAIGAQSTAHFLRPIQEYVKKHGKKKFMELIMEKGGKRLALSLAAKGAFGMTGIGALVSGGLLASDLYQISQWAKEDLGYSEGANKPVTQ